MTLWYRPGQAPAALPRSATDPAGNSWSDLENNAEGRRECGFTEAPPLPDFDPTRERPEWAGMDWVVASIIPTEVSALQARLALLAAGKLDVAEAAIAAANDRTLSIYWAHTSAFHRDHPRMLAITQALGWTASDLDDLFTAAAEIS